MKEIQKLRLYDKLFDYGEMISLTMIIILLVIFLFNPSWMVFFAWYMFVGIFIMVECKGIENGKRLSHLTMIEFDNDPKNKNYFKKMKL